MISIHVSTKINNLALDITVPSRRVQDRWHSNTTQWTLFYNNFIFEININFVPILFQRKTEIPWIYTLALREKLITERPATILGFDLIMSEKCVRFSFHYDQSNEPSSWFWERILNQNVKRKVLILCLNHEKLSVVNSTILLLWNKLGIRHRLLYTVCRLCIS